MSGLIYFRTVYGQWSVHNCCQKFVTNEQQIVIRMLWHRLAAQYHGTLCTDSRLALCRATFQRNPNEPFGDQYWTHLDRHYDEYTRSDYYADLSTRNIKILVKISSKSLRPTLTSMYQKHTTVSPAEVLLTTGCGAELWAVLGGRLHDGLAVTVKLAGTSCQSGLSTRIKNAWSILLCNSAEPLTMTETDVGWRASEHQANCSAACPVANFTVRTVRRYCGWMATGKLAERWKRQLKGAEDRPGCRQQVTEKSLKPILRQHGPVLARKWTSRDENNNNRQTAKFVAFYIVYATPLSSGRLSDKQQVYLTLASWLWCGWQKVGNFVHFFVRDKKCSLLYWTYGATKVSLTRRVGCAHFQHWFLSAPRLLCHIISFAVGYCSYHCAACVCFCFSAYKFSFAPHHL